MASVSLSVPGAGSMPYFEVGHYVLVARVRKLGNAPRLVTTWTEPWRMVSSGSPHVYNVQNIVNGERYTSCRCVLIMRIRLLLWALSYRACSK